MAGEGERGAGRAWGHLMGAFAAHAPAYAAHGLAVFPVDTQAKRPLVRGWQRAGLRAAREWAERFADADGLGVTCGPRSDISEVDVDAVGDAPLAAALDRFGQTPVAIRTASGKSKLWYRHNGEGRHIRVAGDLPIDILGAGFTIAPPSYRADLGASYRFVRGSLDDLACLPRIASGALGTAQHYMGRPGSEVHVGTRNRALWRFAMVQAQWCDDFDALLDCAETFAAEMPDPLGAAEIKRAAESAWSYETAGRNYVGLRRPQVTAEDKTMDSLLDQPDALVLLQLFRRYHSRRKQFAIAPTAMSRAGTPPWHHSRIERAREVLIERGRLEMIAKPRRGSRPGQYRLTP